MKREEKNQISRQRILESAAKEFAEKGYGLSSINVICAEGDISKGILYHYFKDKDELYLTCVQACFDGLTAALKAALPDSVGDIQSRMVKRCSLPRRICGRRSRRLGWNLIGITWRFSIHS